MSDFAIISVVGVAGVIILCVIGILCEIRRESNDEFNKRWNEYLKQRERRKSWWHDDEIDKY